MEIPLLLLPTVSLGTGHWKSTWLASNKEDALAILKGDPVSPSYDCTQILHVCI